MLGVHSSIIAQKEEERRGWRGNKAVEVILDPKHSTNSGPEHPNRKWRRRGTVFTHRFTLHPLRRQGAGGNGRATAERLEPRIHNLPLVVHLNLTIRGELFYRPPVCVWVIHVFIRLGKTQAYAVDLPSQNESAISSQRKTHRHIQAGGE